ncbi:hypothetical protein T492DRAFT_912642, partial [Pavlovales sp. CCMP2436]
ARHWVIRDWALAFSPAWTSGRPPYVECTQCRVPYDANKKEGTTGDVGITGTAEDVGITGTAEDVGITGTAEDVRITGT